jgi:predicted oxidoreductase (fatty acid repression mutant protein)
VVSTTLWPLYWGKFPVHIEQGAGWVSGTVWTGAKKLAATGIPLNMDQLLLNVLKALDLVVPAWIFRENL